MKLVKPGLFVGTREEANNLENLKKFNINCVLTVDSQVLDEQPNSCVADIARLHVYCLDEPTADLLSSFDKCIQFIEEALRNNQSVLVHCLSGVSRSVTVILAYLMKTENVTLEKAICRLNHVYSPEKVNPNPGFMEQLRLYHEMGNTVDESSTIIKQFRLELLANQIRESGHVNGNLMLANSASQCSNDEHYKCKKCRMTLFHSSNIINHKSSQGSQLFVKLKRRNDSQLISDSTKNVDCTSVFIEPVDWMSSSLLGPAIEGKLLCPKCKCRLGSFNWSGMQCSCASWVTPAFQFHKNKIDKVFKINASSSGSLLMQPGSSQIQEKNLRKS